MSASRTGSNVERRFVTTRLGRIHVAMAGTGFPVLLLHQTPRSWDEYRDVLPLLGRDFRPISDGHDRLGAPIPPANLDERGHRARVALLIAGRARARVAIIPVR